jgi:ribosomal protein S18 acetylase RimI-like enzyme
MRPDTHNHGASPLANDVELRPLKADDLEAVCALDKQVFGSARKDYFQRRLEAALRHPRLHFQFALSSPAGLVGFLLARLAGGEFGRPDAVVILEAISVAPNARHDGAGRRLIDGLQGLMQSRGLHTLTTQVDWRNHLMLQFLDRASFTLAPRLLLQRKVDRVPLPQTDEEIEKVPPVVRPLERDDLDALVRIDRRLSGQERGEYFRRKFDEAFEESAILVSQVGLSRGLPVAFAMARVDYGDFGHIEPVAALEVVGVHPDFTRQGFARAVLEQLIENLAALHVDRLETEVAREHFDLLRFLYAFGFEPSQRLAFSRTR